MENESREYTVIFDLFLVLQWYDFIYTAWTDMRQLWKMGVKRMGNKKHREMCGRRQTE